MLLALAHNVLLGHASDAEKLLEKLLCVFLDASFFIAAAVN